MDDLIKDFLQESAENLDRLDQEFVQLEANPGNRELLGSIFRTIHTIKGSCGFLGFSKLEKLTHAGESLLSSLRDGTLHLTPEIADALLAKVDAVRKILQDIGLTSADGEEEYLEVIASLKACQPTKESPPSQRNLPRVFHRTFPRRSLSIRQTETPAPAPRLTKNKSRN